MEDSFTAANLIWAEQLRADRAKAARHLRVLATRFALLVMLVVLAVTVGAFLAAAGDRAI